MALKDLLIKAGLVVDDEQDHQSTNRPSPKEILEFEMHSPAAEGASVTLETAGSGEIAENTSFETIYASSGVPAITFPAERLLKVLDGLRAMDATNRRAAVVAMDAADDAWSVDDVLADASRKIAALQAHVNQLNAAVSDVQERERAQKAALDKDYEVLRASIAEQIAQLQEAQQLAATEHAQAVSALEAKTMAAVGAAQREQLRIQSEIERLNGIGPQVG